MEQVLNLFNEINERLPHSPEVAASLTIAETLSEVVALLRQAETLRRQNSPRADYGLIDCTESLARALREIDGND